MTGYGKFVVTFNGKKIHVEIKSLNSKALDLSTRIAPIYREKEMEIRRMLSETLIRGKVDFAIWVEKDADSDATTINSALLENYYNQIKDISAKTGMPEPQDWFATLMRMPDVLTKTETEELTDEEWTAAREGIDRALNEIVEFRRQEGAALYNKFSEKIDNIAALLASIEPYEQSRVEKIRARITENLKKPGQGKKLGFIAQEMGREINTTGSKSNQAEMQNIVVKMKDELEQIKEQVLNAL